ncbi:MAG: fasciclin domain-containing protein [Bacteroidetes bacterium]|nr:fasciclin domain-containing protein [Bacteroidota bacterium]
MTFTALRRAASATTLAVGLFALALTGCKKDTPAETTPTEAAPPISNTVIDVATADTNFSTLVGLIQATGIANQLNGAGQITVFAPTNAAFAALPTGTLDTLKLEKNRQQLIDLLLFHVAQGNIKAADLKGMQTVTTNVAGTTLPVVVDGDVVKVGDATVVTADVAASNGTVHAINAVLMPPATM